MLARHIILKKGTAGNHCVPNTSKKSGFAMAADPNIKGAVIKKVSCKLTDFTNQGKVLTACRLTIKIC